MFDLKGKKALVTGASGGIGGEIAKTLNEAGAEVAISGTRLESLHGLSDLLDDNTQISNDLAAQIRVIIARKMMLFRVNVAMKSRNFR